MDDVDDEKGDKRGTFTESPRSKAEIDAERVDGSAPQRDSREGSDVEAVSFLSLPLPLPLPYVALPLPLPLPTF